MKRRLFNVATGLSLALFLAGACLWMRSYASGGRIFARALFRYGSYGGAMSYLLVVDDDLDSRDVLCRFLIRAGHECVAVPNGSEAMESILARMPDLIVLDLLMPEMDGITLLEILRSYLRLQSLPVVVLTAAPDSPQAGAQGGGRERGADERGGFTGRHPPHHRRCTSVGGRRAGSPRWRQVRFKDLSG